MTVGFRGGISILELIVYFPSVFLSTWIASRHGLGRSSGWIFLVVFTVVRIVGAACQLDSESNHSKGVITAAVICSSIGLSPLILTCIGLLSRANASIQIGSLHPLLFRLLGTLVIVSAILCVVGGVNSSSSSDPTKVETLTKAGIGLFLLGWASLSLLLLAIWLRISHVALGERRLILAVAISVPFLFVRLLYSALASFANQPRFKLYTGSVTIMLVMAVLEEFVIVLVCLGIGITLQRQPKAIQNKVSGMASGSHGIRRVKKSRRGFRAGKRQGPITKLVNLGMALGDRG